MPTRPEGRCGLAGAPPGPKDVPGGAEVKSCDKIAYQYRSMAEWAADAIQAKGHKSLWSYRCPECRLFHLTSQRQ